MALPPSQQQPPRSSTATATTVSTSDGSGSSSNATTTRQTKTIHVPAYPGVIISWLFTGITTVLFSANAFFFIYLTLYYTVPRFVVILLLSSLMCRGLSASASLRISLRRPLFYQDSRFVICVPFLIACIGSILLGIISGLLLVMAVIVAPEALYATSLIVFEGSKAADVLLVPYQEFEVEVDEEATASAASSEEGGEHGTAVGRSVGGVKIGEMWMKEQASITAAAYTQIEVKA